MKSPSKVSETVTGFGGGVGAGTVVMIFVCEVVLRRVGGGPAVVAVCAVVVGTSRPAVGGVVTETCPPVPGVG